MTQKVENMIDLFMELSKVVRKKSKYCYINSRNCNICNFNKKGKCELYEKQEKIKLEIKELSKIK